MPRILNMRRALVTLWAATTLLAAASVANADALDNDALGKRVDPTAVAVAESTHSFAFAFAVPTPTPTPARRTTPAAESDSESDLSPGSFILTPPANAGTFTIVKPMTAPATPKPTVTVKPTKPPIAASAMAAPTTAPTPKVTQTPAPPIPAEAMSVETTSPSWPATVKPAETDVATASPSTVYSSDGSAAAAAAAAAAASTPLTVVNQSDSSTVAAAAASTNGSCPLYNEITSNCGNVCPNNALCIKYRSGGECLQGNITTCIHPPGQLCAYECLEGTSADIDEWHISPFGVPAWDPALHNNTQIEAMRAVDVPRNITQLSLQFLFDALDGQVVKGKVATLEFPDQRILSESAALSSIAIVNLDSRKLPPATYAPQLQALVLENCLLTSLPEPILGLSQLNLLNVASNSITKLSPKLGQLPLAGLYLDNNGMTEFPGFIANMSSLKAVSLVKNNLTKFTTVARASALTELALDYNQLADFAGVIPSLNTLYLRGNRLTAFPSTLTLLTNLELLDLTENQLSSQAIGAAVKSLTHPNLIELMLGGNGLHQIPDLSNVFPLLKTLSVHNNSIETVEGTYLGKLEVLKAMSNKIKTFKASFSRLTALDLSDNKLESLPDVASISNVLQSLNVSGNGLEKLVETKPLTTLTEFNASGNSLSSFSLAIPTLRSLDLSKNQFESIPPSVWTYNVLDQLHLNGNPKMKNVMVTRDQLSFLKRLSAFTMDASAIKQDCPDTWKSELKGVMLCVENGDDATATLKSSGSRTSPWTWFSIIVGAVAVLAVVVFIFVVRRRRHYYDSDDYPHTGLTKGSLKAHDHTAGLTQSGGYNTLARSHPNAGIWDDDELNERRVDYDSIKLERKLAAGAYGEVWIGMYRSDTVAVKKLSDAGKRDKRAVSYFVSEIKLLAQLDHPRIIHFYGVAWTCLTDLCAVIEFMPGGDLYSMLRSNLLPSTHWNAAKLQIALDTVEALTYVHTLEDVLIHRDLKSRNVLLDDEWRAKVTDFGISRFQREEDATMTSGIGTGRWMAPEVIQGRADYDEKVDIYSFGVILSELDTHEMPYTHSADSQLPTTEMGILQQVAAGELRPSFSRNCPPSILEIAQKCLAFRPEDRPPSLEVAYLLRQLIPMFPHEEVARPSSVFSRGTMSFTSMNPFRKSQATAANIRPGSEITLRSNGPVGEITL